MNGLGSYHVVPTICDDMTKNKVKTYASILEHDVSIPGVNSNRGEINQPTVRVTRDEGRFKRPDCAHLKRGNDTLRIGTCIR